MAVGERPEVHVHAPASTTSVQIVVAPSDTVTVSLARPVPENVTVDAATVLPFAGWLTTGAAAAIVSLIDVPGPFRPSS